MTAVVVVGAPQWDGGALARALALPLCASAADLPATCIAFLSVREQRLQLFPANSQSGPISVDFVGGASAQRARGGSELIVKAVKGRSKLPLHVLDATAGLGRDSFVLAGHGFQVTMFEREAVIAALLEDGLQRARDSIVADTVARMNLQRGDFIDGVEPLAREHRPDIVYLDPMFPHADKSALVKKEMRLFQQLFAGVENREALLLERARSAARLRVVVKRALKAECLAAVEPAYSLSGKAVRFDVYPA